MIKTKKGIYIELQDVIFLLKSQNLFIPPEIKKKLSELLNYCLYNNFNNSIILLKTGCILENAYLSAIDKKIFHENSFKNKNNVIILWDDDIAYKNNKNITKHF